MSNYTDLSQRLRDQQPGFKNAATEYNPLWDEAADAIDALIEELEEAQRTNELSGVTVEEGKGAEDTIRRCLSRSERKRLGLAL